jgi:hypothetical protein
MIELYDLSNDSGELQNLAASRSDLVNELLPYLGKPATRSHEAPDTPALPLDEEEVQLLRELGYEGSSNDAPL